MMGRECWRNFPFGYNLTFPRTPLLLLLLARWPLSYYYHDGSTVPLREQLESWRSLYSGLQFKRNIGHQLSSTICVRGCNLSSYMPLLRKYPGLTRLSLLYASRAQSLLKCMPTSRNPFRRQFQNPCLERQSQTKWNAYVYGGRARGTKYEGLVS
jgi:hypothetical protein